MAYNSAIPQANNKLSQSQNDLLNNFTALGAIAGVSGVPNSASLNNTAGFNFVYLPPQGATPPVGSAFGNNIGLYSFNNATTTKNELYVHKQQNATTTEVPMTASTLSNSTPVGLTQGYTYLPSGIILAWGSQLILNAGITTVNIPFTFSNANRILFVTISPSGLASGGAVTGQVSFIAVTGTNTFTASAQGPVNVVGKFLVIGY